MSKYINCSTLKPHCTTKYKISTRKCLNYNYSVQNIWNQLLWNQPCVSDGSLELHLSYSSVLPVFRGQCHWFLIVHNLINFDWIGGHVFNVLTVMLIVGTRPWHFLSICFSCPIFLHIQVWLILHIFWLLFQDPLHNPTSLWAPCRPQTQLHRDWKVSHGLRKGALHNLMLCLLQMKTIYQAKPDVVLILLYIVAHVLQNVMVVSCMYPTSE